ncbi:MAG: vWA domain-containing protein [Clostridiales bacterium]
MKKLTAMFLLFALIFNLASCTKAEKDTAGPGENQPRQEDAGAGLASLAIAGGKSPPPITGLVPEPADGIGVAGVDYQELPTGPADDWGDLPVPYFNPLGSFKLYQGARQADHATPGFTTLDDYTLGNLALLSLERQWVLDISHEDFTLNWLRAYAKSLGAVEHPAPADSAVFEVQENPETCWWAVATKSSGGCRLDIYRLNMAPAGQTITIKTSELTENVFHLYTDCVQGKLQSATVTIKGKTNSEVHIDLYQRRSYGEYDRYVGLPNGYEAHHGRFNNKRTDTYVIDNIPVCEGKLVWTFEWPPEDNAFNWTGLMKPEEITFRIDNAADIPQVKWGEALGAIRIAGLPAGAADVIPQPGVDPRHDEVTGSQDSYGASSLDAEGNQIFTLPPGYYNLRFAREGYAINLASQVQLVPVSAGEITTVTVPPELRSTIEELGKRYGTFESSAGGIEIQSNKDNGDTATVSIVVNDPGERDVFPENQDIKITENGLAAKVTKIQREPAAANVVLVLDSSGSMGANMKPAVEAAKKFVASLPDNAGIRLVQFAQKITPHKALGKEEVIAALDTVKEGGGTALYDAADTALGMLKDMDKAYVVIFSDGADSRELTGAGKGSTLNKAAILEKIKASGATVLSIGFGEGHDPRVLVEMSEASPGGAYFAAIQPQALDSAFAAVSGRFGNQFTITYDRPTALKDKSGDVPVISFMIDRSGSMDMDPAESENDVDYRIDKIKKLFHDYVLALPAGTLMQLGSFRLPPGGAPEEINYNQVTTDSKARILSGLGSFFADGGTPILEALTVAYYNLLPVPSSKRTLVYFTDAALAVDELEKVQLEKILTQYKEAGIRILFAGLGNEKFAEAYQSGFQTAARLSGGEYVLSDKIEDIQKALDTLMQKLDLPAAAVTGVSFAIEMDARTEDGSRMNYSAAKVLQDFSRREAAGKTVNPEIIRISSGEPYIRYDSAGSRLLYGTDKPGQDSVIQTRLSFTDAEGVEIKKGAAGQNNLISLAVREAYFMPLFKGLEAKNIYSQFLALNVDIEFPKTAAGPEEYLIPDIFSHFYAGVNGTLSPASQATWLAENPLAQPGNPGVDLKKGGKKSGILIFLVPRQGTEPVTQLSLHFYDVNNGHVQIPIVGILNEKLLEIDQLPAAAPANISETFSLTLKGKRETAELAGVSIYQNTDPAAAAKNTTFRVLEAQFASKVQAHLNIQPQERFFYAIETNQGPLAVKMSDAVYNMPLGFGGGPLLAPVSAANVRLPFQIPLALGQSKSYLFADLRGDSLEIPVTEGQPYQTAGLGKSFSHPYFDLTINALGRLAEGSNKIVLDFTLRDKPDGTGLSGVQSLFLLSKEETVAADGSHKLSAAASGKAGADIAAGRKGLGSFGDSDNGKGLVSPGSETDKLLFGADGHWAVLDNNSRRGIMIFSLPHGEDVTQWGLCSGLLEELWLPVEDAVYGYLPLLAEKQEVPRSLDFQRALEEKVSAAVAAYQSSRSRAKDYTTLGLTSGENVHSSGLAPALTLYGSRILESVNSYEDFLQVMYGLGMLPGIYHSYWYAPEAVLTQGWGTQLDLASLACHMLSRLGYQPQVRSVDLTATGKENAGRIMGLDYDSDYTAGILYTDEEGVQQVFVLPFMRTLTELPGLAYLGSRNEYSNGLSPARGTITVTARAQLIKPKEDANSAQVAAFNSLNAMFAEEGSATADQPAFEDVLLFHRELSMPALSRDVMDISYVAAGKSKDGQSDILIAVFDSGHGLLYDETRFIDTSFYEIQSVTIEAGRASHTTYLEPGQKLSDVVHTFAFGTPEMTAEAAAALTAAVAGKLEEAKTAGDYGTVRWIGHSAAGRFIRGLTAFEAEQEPRFGLVAARTHDHPMAFMVTMKSDGEKATATTDLMDIQNPLLTRPSREQIDGFSIAHGIYASMLEGEALGGDKAVGFMEVWSALPQDAQIYLVPKEKMLSTAEALEKAGGPPKLIERLKKEAESSPSRKMFFLPSQPALIDGKERWAWLEVREDSDGTRAISISETGERSAMAQYVLLNAASVGMKPLSAEGIAGFLYGITCSNWGIAAYSLELDDPVLIRARAYALMDAIAEKLETIESVKDIPADMASKGQKIEEFIVENADKELTEIVIEQLKEKAKAHVEEVAKSALKFADVPLMPFMKDAVKGKDIEDSGGDVAGYSFSEGFRAAVDAMFPEMSK